MQRNMISLVATMAAPGDPNKVSETLANKLQRGANINKSIVGDKSEKDEEMEYYDHSFEEVWSLTPFSCSFYQASKDKEHFISFLLPETSGLVKVNREEPQTFGRSNRFAFLRF